MGGYGTKQEHMNWAVQRALTEYDGGRQETAIASFVSDMNKHSDTEWIAHHPMTLIVLQAGLGSRADFESAMRGFNI